jgi:Zn-dependent peptidase ImmA (M78 family)/DNA-binding XRE family transcriptional regulator
MIGERIKRARAAAGLSMQALADQVGLSANMIKKYEHDKSMPSSPVLLKLASALSVRTEYFFRPATITLAEIEYRKKSSAPKKLLQRIEADVIDQAERWFELSQLWPNFPIPKFEFTADLPRIESLDQIDAVAERVREHWQLGVNPLPDLIDLLESKGILVIISQEEKADKIDGLMAHIDDQPVVVISSCWPGCRQRFTLAHELGHLILHNLLPEHIDEENACNRFASAFLLPAHEVFQHLGKTRSYIELQELYLLKQEYGLSMQACLYRIADLGVISESKRQRIFIQFSKNGWRKLEPGEQYPKERTRLFQQLVFRALAEEIISESKAAELLQIAVMALHKQRLMQLEVA